MKILQMEKQTTLQLPSTSGSCCFLWVSAGGLDSEAAGTKIDIIMLVRNIKQSVLVKTQTTKILLHLLSLINSEGTSF